jgi:hypothetical protein
MAAAVEDLLGEDAARVGAGPQILIPISGDHKPGASAAIGLIGAALVG